MSGDQLSAGTRGNGTTMTMSRRLSFLWIGACLVSVATTCAIAEHGSAVPESQNGASVAAAPEKPAKPRPTPRQRQVLLVGVYLLAAVACVGAVLLIWIVWWGSRLRSFNRRSLPTARTQDPFWFLKQPVEKPPGPGDGDLGNPPAEPPGCE